MLTHEQLTERFQRVIDELKIKKIIRHETEIADALDMTPQGVYSMKTGRSKVSMKTLQLLFDKFEINPKYFFDIKAQMWENMLPDHIEPLEDGTLKINLVKEDRVKYRADASHIKQLENHLRDKDLIIQLLQDRLKKCEDEHRE